MESSEIYEKLKEYHIRPSRQRVFIYKNLAERDDHPTAEMIFNDLKDRIPSLSKTTIYNTMKLFEEHGLVQTIQVDGIESRFDFKRDNRAYAYCKNCKKMWNQPLDSYIVEDIEVPGLEVEDTIVIFNGICDECREN